jgi:hypothetical protein
MFLKLQAIIILFYYQLAMNNVVATKSIVKCLILFHRFQSNEI